jgi:hypothetical protein
MSGSYCKLSIFHVTTSVCDPDRVTDGLGARVKTSAVVEQPVVPQLAIVVKAELLNVPAEPVAPVHVTAPQDTSEADHVGVPACGGVNREVLALSDNRMPVLVVCRVNSSTATLSIVDDVCAFTLVTAKSAVVGMVTVACSSTLTVRPVVWLVSGRMTVV